MDGLRAVAFLTVIAAHLNLPRIDGGFYALDWFLVLSGYLIGVRLLTPSAPARDVVVWHLRSRAVRILPELLVMLALLTPIGAYLMVSRDWQDFALVAVSTVGSFVNFTFAFAADTEGGLNHLWSLALEVQFYLAAPVLMLALRRRPALLAACLLTIAGLSAGLRAVTWDGKPYGATYVLPHTRADGFLFGCLLALLHVRRRSLPVVVARALPAAATVSLSTLAFLVVKHLPPRFAYSYGFVLSGILATVICACVLWRPDSVPSRMLSPRAGVWLSERTYGGYLWHYPVVILLALTGLKRNAYWAYVAVTYGAAFALGHLSRRYVGLPVAAHVRDRQRSYGAATAEVVAGEAGALPAHTGPPGSSEAT
ncbi:MAG TPA: acyltransferase [Actinomycetota bacterium]|nr:acyltransferase [Actinomycetota bacterium]